MRHFRFAVVVSTSLVLMTGCAHSHPLCDPAEQGDVVAVRALLKAGITADPPDTTKGRRPLNESAKNGHAEVVGVLLAAGAPVDLPDGAGWRPLHLAAANGHPTVVKILLDSGAQVNLQIPHGAGRTPLHAAAENAQLETARLLLAAGAWANAPNARGIRPLHLAAYHGHTDMAKLLLAAGAKSDVKTHGEEIIWLWNLDFGENGGLWAGKTPYVLARRRPWNLELTRCMREAAAKEGVELEDTEPLYPLVPWVYPVTIPIGTLYAAALAAAGAGRSNFRFR